MSEALPRFLSSSLADRTADELVSATRGLLQAQGWSVDAATSTLDSSSWPTRTWTARLHAAGGPDDLWLDVRAEFHPSKASVGLSQRWTVMVRWESRRLLAGVTALNTAYHVLLGDLPHQEAQLASALNTEKTRNPQWATDAAAAFAELLASRLQP